MRRAAEQGDAWHPLGLSFEQLEQGIGQIRELAAKAGRASAVGFAPRNLLAFTAKAKGSGRVAFQGSPEEVATDVKRALALGCQWLTFDLPRESVAAMTATMERFASEVRPEVA
jgi:alkanesulfonate monooxygenase SsuD/methylene tetrahydromethanopterin reductase-like flavin-dependent oxidoreductase (luciferase family)